MASPYTEIAREHRLGYGAFDHHLEGYEDFYSDDTHFVYELIQNAQDALFVDPDKETKRRLLQLVLREGELLAWNDGKPFTEDNVRAICSIRESQKDLAQIGTHGIGFKAVGKFTDLPEIYSGDERFRIHRRVEPQRIEEMADEVRRLVDSGCTVFRLPFKASLRPEDTRRLGERLRHVHKWALLFLHDLRSVEWVDERQPAEGGASSGVYRCDRRKHPALRAAHTVALQSEVDGKGRPAERFLCFLRESRPPDRVIDELLHQVRAERERDRRERDKIERSRRHAQPIEIAFRLDEQDRIVPLAGESSVLFSFLPTRKEMHLRFLVQAHFKTTFARDDIRDLETSAWNRWLLEEVAAFLPDILLELKAADMLTPAVIRALPIPGEDVLDAESRPRLLHPLLASGVAALTEHALIPAEAAGVHGRAAQVFHPHNQALRRLLSAADRAEITGVESAAWIHPDLRWDGGTEGELLRAAGVREVTPAQVVSWLAAKDGAWFEAKNDAWVAELYRYLASPALRAERERLRPLPLARRENGRHVCAGAEPVFFPPAGDEETKLVAPLLSLLPLFRGSLLAAGGEAGDEGIRGLLGFLGVRSLSLGRLLTDWLLPRYRQEHAFSVEENRAHLRFILQARERLSAQEAAALTKEASTTPFLRCYQGVERRAGAFKAPGDAYLSSAYTGSGDLELYFGDGAEVWFVEEGYLDEGGAGEAWRKALKEFGAATSPRRLRIPDATLEESFKASLRGGNGHASDIDIEDYTLDGLDAALARIRRQDDAAGGIARALWRLLPEAILPSPRQHPPLPRQQNPLLVGVYRWLYYSEQKKRFFAAFDRQLRATAWVPSDRGNFRRPGDLYAPDAETRRVLGDGAEFLHPDLGVRESQHGTPERNLAVCLAVRLNVEITTALERLEQLSGSAPAVQTVEPCIRFCKAAGCKTRITVGASTARP